MHTTTALLLTFIAIAATSFTHLAAADEEITLCGQQLPVDNEGFFCNAELPPDLSQISALTHLKIFNLSISGPGALDLSALAAAKQIEEIYINAPYAVVDIAPLAALTDLKQVFLESGSISDLSSLAALPKLTRIDLRRCGMPDLSVLAKLPSLKYLMILGMPIQDISALSSFNSLETLIVSNSYVEDISPVAKLPHLKTLEITNTDVRDLAPLSASPSLETLYCGDTDVKDLSPLASLRSLKSLTISASVDLATLAGVTSLEELTIRGKDIADLSSVSKLTALQTLTLQALTFPDLGPLASLPKLKKIHIVMNDKSPEVQAQVKEQIIALKAARSELSIHLNIPR